MSIFFIAWSDFREMQMIKFCMHYVDCSHQCAISYSDYYYLSLFNRHNKYQSWVEFPKGLQRNFSRCDKWYFCRSNAHFIYLYLLSCWFASKRNDCRIVSWQEFIDKCQMLIETDGLREQLRLSAQQYINKHHSPQHEKQQYINVISELVHLNEK